MNNEIKEILDKWKCYIGLTKKFSNNDMELLRVEDIEKVLDYITNLQQENEDNLKCIKSLKEQLESVINENQRLLKQWFDNNDKAVELISEKEYYSQNFKNYKSRCEKAIDKLKRDYYINFYSEHNDNVIDEVLNILQNGSDRSE